MVLRHGSGSSRGHTHASLTIARKQHSGTNSRVCTVGLFTIKDETIPSPLSQVKDQLFHMNINGDMCSLKQVTVKEEPFRSQPNENGVTYCPKQELVGIIRAVPDQINKHFTTYSDMCSDRQVTVKEESTPSRRGSENSRMYLNSFAESGHHVSKLEQFDQGGCVLNFLV